MGACGGVYAWNHLLEVEVKREYTRAARDNLIRFQEHFVMSVRSLEPGRYYTLVTSAFMHHGAWHLGVNMLCLWPLGRGILMLSGTRSFLVLYFGSAIAGGVAQVYYWKANRSPHASDHGVGASGAISGLFAAITLVSPMSPSFILPIPVPIPMVVAALLGVVISVGGIQGRWLPGLGHADHLGGMAFGVLWYLVAFRRGRL